MEQQYYFITYELDEGGIGENLRRNAIIKGETPLEWLWDKKRYEPQKQYTLLFYKQISNLEYDMMKEYEEYL